MDKGAFFFPYFFKKDHQRFYAVTIGGGVGLAGFGYLGVQIGQGHGGLTYVIVTALAILGCFLGQCAGAAVYDITERKHERIISWVVHGFAPLEWLLVGLALLVLAIGVWGLVSFYYSQNLTDLLLATFFLSLSTGLPASWTRSWWVAGVDLILLIVSIFLVIRTGQMLSGLTIFLCLFFGGGALLPKRPRR